jgi:hypothetical protein
MSTTVDDRSAAGAMSAKAPLDKFAEARRAKKKQKRARHRAKLRRSHTKG